MDHLGWLDGKIVVATWETAVTVSNGREGLKAYPGLFRERRAPLSPFPNLIGSLFIYFTWFICHTTPKKL